jgi:ATP-dependent metalloprotease FtsH
MDGKEKEVNSMVKESKDLQKIYDLTNSLQKEYGQKYSSVELFFEACLRFLQEKSKNGQDGSDPEVREMADLFWKRFASFNDLLEGVHSYDTGVPSGRHQKLEIEDFLREVTQSAEEMGVETLTASSVFSRLLEKFGERLEMTPHVIAINVMDEDQPSAIAVVEQHSSTLPEVREKEELVPEGKVQDVPEARREQARALIQKADALQNTLLDTVKGQTQAVSFLVSGWLNGEMKELMGPVDERPRASFLFAGPRGTGMSLMIRTFAHAVHEDIYTIQIPGNSPEAIAGLMIDVIRKTNEKATADQPARKKCIFVLDHMEPGVTTYPLQAFFAQILDGMAQQAATVSFRDCILIFTTGAGASSLYDNPEIPDPGVLTSEQITDALKKETFEDQNGKSHPAYIAGFLDLLAQGSVAVFKHVTAPVMAAIARRSMENQAEQMQKNMGIGSELDPRLPSAVLFHLGEKASADFVKYAAEDLFTHEMTELVRISREEMKKIKRVKFDIVLPEDNEAASLFVQNQKQEVLVFASKKDTASIRSTRKIHINKAETMEEGQNLLQKTDVRLVLLDFTAGMRDMRYSNIEDSDSCGRDFMRFLRKEHADLPVYMIETDSHVYTEEEKLSFLRKGIRGFLKLKDTDHPFREQLASIAEDLYLDDSLLSLEKMRGRLSWGTRQSIDEKGVAHIELFELQIKKGSLFTAGEAAISDVEMPSVRFDDVIGAEDAKQELRFFISYLRDPRKFTGSGLEAPKGVLLYGPPGTGKTMLAKAMASEAGIAFIACDGSEFLQKYVGDGPALVHKYFQRARKFAPAVLFIDEIDAIGLNRASDEARYSRDILTAFFTEMDGFHTSPDKPVFVMAATNAAIEGSATGTLDPALIRRFDRRILVDLPDMAGREKYLHKMLEENPNIRLNDKQVHTIAENTSGLSLAIISQIINLAKRLALRASKNTIDEKIITEAMEQYTSGDRRKRSEEENLRTARHEAGHAFLQWKAGKHPAYISIESRSDHHGYVRGSEEDFEKMNSKSEILDYIRWCLGGRAAELVYYGDDDGLTMGPSADLQQATSAAEQLFTRYGMDESFGMAVVDPNRLSEKKYNELLDKVNALLKQELEEGKSEISSNRRVIDAFVKTLMVREHLNGDEIETIFRKESAKRRKKVLHK